MYRKSFFAILLSVSFLVAGAADATAQTSAAQYGLQVTQILTGAGRVYGIETGDVIVSVDGQLVQNLDELNYRLGRAGWKARLGVIDARSGWLNEIVAFGERCKRSLAARRPSEFEFRKGRLDFLEGGIGDVGAANFQHLQSLDLAQLLDAFVSNPRSADAQFLWILEFFQFVQMAPPQCGFQT